MLKLSLRLLVLLQLINLWNIFSFQSSPLSVTRSYHPAQFQIALLSSSSHSPAIPNFWKLQVLTTDHNSHHSRSTSSHYRPSRSWMQEREHPKIDLLYDSECPLCSMEVEFLKKRDIYQRIRFTDISAPDYDPTQHGDVAYEDGMKKLRAVLPDRRVITGVEVFRHTYDAIGLGWVFAMTRLPFIGQVADAVYDFWAENRLRITGRHDLAEKLKAKAEALRNYEPEECDGTCALDDEDD